MPMTSRTKTLSAVARWSALLGLVALTGCSTGASGAETTAGIVRSGSPSPAPSAAPAVTVVESVPTVEVPVKDLTERLRPDVLVVGAASLTAGAVSELTALSPSGGAIAFRAGVVSLGGQDVNVVGIDPSTFRTFTAQGTAEATAVWQSVARGEIVASHDIAKTLNLALGAPVALNRKDSGTPSTLRLGALATTGVPGADLIVDNTTADALGLPAATRMLLTAGKDKDPVALAAKVRAVTGGAAEVDLLTPPAANPTAFLTGSKAAQQFGAFSYRYFPDGTIQPDAAWVRANIKTETLPIMGRVTCHRLMLPQLRGALQDVVDAGLASTLTTYDGCYVPRFIERNPENSISLHTWGIAIDMDAATNYRGIKGTMHPEVVNIFKRWGFRWGGDWKFTDPMHFELAALITPAS